MSQKRKIEVSVSNFDRNKTDVGLSFQNAANEVTKLYHQATNFQQIAFDDGRRHSLAKVYEWVSSQIQDGKLVTSADVVGYIQNELNDSLPTRRRHLQLEALAQGSGSNQSRTPRNVNVEANSVSSCSAASIETREPGENLPCQDHDMEEDPAHV